MSLISATAIKRKTRLLLLSGLMALAVVGGQWLGFYHGIVHSGLGVETQLSTAFEHTKQAGLTQSEPVSYTHLTLPTN